MSTFDGIVKEFPEIRIDHFGQHGQRPLACFLSHVHTDHLKGLEAFKSPFVYCSAATKELLLRLEKYPHRMNFAKNVLETRKQTYRHLKKLLRPIPLQTPTTIELYPGYAIRVTLFDANHCPGAVMFLIEDDKKAILYTGDIRSEQWWIDALVRSPFMVPYSSRLKRLDNIYMDTTFATSEAPYKDFPSKFDGVAELLRKVSEYPAETIFYMNSWTFGYEEVWLALSSLLHSPVHLDAYRYRLCHSLGDNALCDSSETANLVGFQLGNEYHRGMITKDEAFCRIHSCERGNRCSVFANASAVTITPIVTRHKGIEYAEMGAGGGNGDMDQIHELELDDIATVGSLMQLCSAKLKDNPGLLQKVMAWLATSVKKGGANVKLETSKFFDALDHERSLAQTDDIPLDRLVKLLEDLATTQPEPVLPSSKTITFPYSRHASYSELRALVQALRPRSLHPCTVEPGLDMDALFGDLMDGQDAAMNSSASKTSPAVAVPAFTTAPAPTTVPTSETVSTSTTMPSPTIAGVKRGLSEAELQLSAARRQRAFKAASGGNGEWASNVRLSSVSGYHNQDPEEEL